MHELATLLDFRELTASYRAADVLGELPFTNDFYINPRDTITDEVELVYFPGSTTPAPLNVRGGPSRKLQNLGGTKRYATLFYAFNSIRLDSLALRALREPESYTLQEKGRQIVENQVENFRNRHAYMKEAVIASIMTKGRVNIDADGNVLTPTVDSLTGAITDATNTVISADFTVPNSNRGNLNDSTDGGAIIDSLWSNSATMISRHLDKIRYRSSKFGRPMPTEVYVHGVPGRKFLRDNAEFKEWAKYTNQRSVEEVLRGGVIMDLWGWNWHFIDGTYQDSGGTYRDLLPQTSAIVCPKPGPWLRAYRGATDVPRDLNIVGDHMSVLNAYEVVYGQAAWAKLVDDPVALALYMADSFGLSFADPNAIYMPTVFDAQGASGTG